VSELIKPTELDLTPFLETTTRPRVGPAAGPPNEQIKAVPELKFQSDEDYMDGIGEDYVRDHFPHLLSPAQARELSDLSD
jgi:hypothetical protein